MHDENCSITLTYADECVPRFFSLRYLDFQLFLKRLRARFNRAGIRFYMCGEYGETTLRPHYHACLFGVNFPDRLYAGKTPAGSRLYSSRLLEDLWPFGHSSVGEMSFESAAYVARYCMKKVTGQLAAKHYEVIDASTGEICSRTPEFNKMSLRPGIGAAWLARWFSDVYPRGKVVVSGAEANPPRYYDKIWEREIQAFAGIEGAASFDRMKFNRFLDGQLHQGDQSPERLRVREQVAEARLNLFRRQL